MCCIDIRLHQHNTARTKGGKSNLEKFSIRGWSVGGDGPALFSGHSSAAKSISASSVTSSAFLSTFYQAKHGRLLRYCRTGRRTIAPLLSPSRLEGPRQKTVME